MKKNMAAGLLTLSLLITTTGANTFALDKPTPVTISAPVETGKNYLFVADAALYKGVIEKIENGDLLVSRRDKNENTYTSLVFHMDENTRFNLSKAVLKVGQQVDIFYSGKVTKSLPGQATAISVNIVETVKEIDNNMVGRVTKVVSDQNGSRIIVDALTTKAVNKTIVFHLGKDTRYVGGSIKNLKIGSAVKITYGSALLESMPPQTGAKIVKIIK